MIGPEVGTAATQPCAPQVAVPSEPATNPASNHTTNAPENSKEFPRGSLVQHLFFLFFLICGSDLVMSASAVAAIYLMEKMELGDPRNRRCSRTSKQVDTVDSGASSRMCVEKEQSIRVANFNAMQANSGKSGPAIGLSRNSPSQPQWVLVGSCSSTGESNNS